MASPRPDEVYFFGTCLVDILFPEAGLCAVELIEREGIEVIFPQDQTCCGQPAYNAGYRKEALAVASAQLSLLSRPIPVVVPSGSCAGMMKHHYPILFRGHPLEAEANQLANRVHELTEFLHRILQISLTDLGPPIQVALHTSCSSRREMGVTEDGKALLGQLSNVAWKEPEGASECCGFGGTFAVRQPGLSTTMGQDKCEALKHTGASQFVTGDCGCLMHLNALLDRSEPQTDFQGQHIAEFLWARTTEGAG